MYKPEESKRGFKHKARDIIKSLFARKTIPLCNYCVHHFEIYDRDGIFEISICMAIGYKECRKVYDCRRCKKVYAEIEEVTNDIEVIDED